ncbi:MAG: PQQ-dependent sugar dehydrogenase, partial [Micromonosporaceae bacterium]|nr:PQQ-dependent sugar dehydrogenase [Micromonosporaceae bacterium]
GNPYHNLVFGIGLHDPQGLAWDPSKRLYASDYSQDAWSEVNQVQPGKNYGWPTVVGAVHNASYVDPIAQWRPVEGACAGTAVAEEILITACLDGTRLYALQLTTGGTVLGAPQPLLKGDFGRLRSIAKAPDGSLWVATSNKDGKGTPGPDDDRIVRFIPSGSAGSLS